MSIRDKLGRLFGGASPRTGSQTSAGGRPWHDDAGQERMRRGAVEHEGILTEEFAKKLEAADRGRVFPESPRDPVEYLGNIEPLGLTEDEKDIVRQWTSDLVEERGDRAVWNSRLRLKLELRYLIAEGGLQKMPGGKDAGRRT